MIYLIDHSTLVREDEQSFEVLDFTRRQAKRLAFVKWLFESQTKCADNSPIRPLEGVSNSERSNTQ